MPLALALIALAGSLSVLVGICAPAVADRIRYGTQQRPGSAHREAWEFRRIVIGAALDIPKYPSGGWSKEAADIVIGRLEEHARARVLVELAQLARDPEVDADTLRQLTELFVPENEVSRPSGG